MKLQKDYIKTFGRYIKNYYLTNSIGTHEILVHEVKITY